MIYQTILSGINGKEYMYIRSSFVMIAKISAHFPFYKKEGNALLKRVEQLVKEESEREDLQIMARSLIIPLKKNQSSWFFDSLSVPLSTSSVISSKSMTEKPKEIEKKKGSDKHSVSDLKTSVSSPSLVTKDNKDDIGAFGIGSKRKNTPSDSKDREREGSSSLPPSKYPRKDGDSYRPSSSKGGIAASTTASTTTLPIDRKPSFDNSRGREYKDNTNNRPLPPLQDDRRSRSNDRSKDKTSHLNRQNCKSLFFFLCCWY
jgi:hypothetical protein